MLRAHYHSTLSCGGDEDDDVAIPCEKDNVDDGAVPYDEGCDALLDDVHVGDDVSFQ